MSHDTIKDSTLKAPRTYPNTLEGERQMKADAQEFMHGKIGCPACQPHPMLCPLHATAIELLAALKVAREWMGSDAPRQSLKLHKAQNMVDVAISHAEGR